MGRLYLSQASRWQSGDLTWHPWKLILVMMAISKRHIQRVEHGSLAFGQSGEDGWRWMKMIGFSRLWSGVPLEKTSDHSTPAPKKHGFWWKGLQDSFFYDIIWLYDAWSTINLPSHHLFETSSDQVLKCPEDFRWPEVWQFEFRDSIHM